ncbi:CAP domain-containing protein [Caballeronia sp. GAFFF2]|uniref:CAP domain-containing protein n=1 Tax=Caballeronia sp. GAFFF2 TaxID=2921741 RepID=UPI0020291EE2|nr:CAP domain-containing protein [Caballeronia sp. GAFFF2]
MASAAAFALFLAACGGGGGNSGGAATTPAGSGANTGGGANTGADTNTNTSSISLLTPAGAGAASFTATGDAVNDSLAYANAMRAQLGLPVLKYVSAVGTAALNHAKNMQDTNSVGHYETAGQPDFTGVSPTDRVAAAGYTTNSVGEIAAGFPGNPANPTGFSSSTEAIDGLFDAPFHRAIFLFDTTGVGMGQVPTTDPTKYSTFVGDFVDYVASTPDNKLVAYPYAGQTNVKPTWLAIETPNPLAANHPQLVNTVVGYPVTLTAAGNGAFSNVSFAITDASGAAVQCDEMDNSNNAEATRLAVCVPIAPLANNTTYKVTATGSLTNTSITTATPFSVSWSFTTGTTTGSSNTSATPSAATSAKSQRSPGAAGANRLPVFN